MIKIIAHPGPTHFGASKKRLVTIVTSCGVLKENKVQNNWAIWGHAKAVIMQRLKSGGGDKRIEQLVPQTGSWMACYDDPVLQKAGSGQL